MTPHRRCVDESTGAGMRLARLEMELLLEALLELDVDIKVMGS